MLNSINAVNNRSNNKQEFGMALTTDAAQEAIKVAGKDLGLLKRVEEIATKAAENKNFHVTYSPEYDSVTVGKIIDGKFSPVSVPKPGEEDCRYLDSLAGAVDEAARFEAKKIADAHKQILDLSV